MPIKMVITGDNHLNYYSQRLGSKLSKRRSQIGSVWRKTVDFAIKKKVDLYLNVGDLFDQVSPRNPPRARVIKAFVDLKEAGIKSFLISGTHDSPANFIEGASPQLLLQEAGLATVFENTKSFGQKIVNIGKTTVSIAGISSDRRFRPNMDPLKGITIPNEADFNIAMLHYSVENIAPHYWEEPMIPISSLERNKHIDLFAIGHIHQHITQNLGDSLILYTGATEHFDFGEAKNDTGFCYVEVEGKKTKVDFIPTKSQPMTQEKIHASQFTTENPMETIQNIIVKASNPRGLFQLVLEGDMSFEEYLKIDFTRIYDEGKERNFYFEYLDNINPLIKDIEYHISEDLHPRKDLISVANQAINNADVKEKEFWERALELAVSYYDRYNEM